MGAAKTVFLTILTIAGILLIALSFAASYADEYLKERITEDCEDEVGTIGELIGADEGQCQDARDLREQVASVGRTIGFILSLIHICRCRRSTLCRSRWSQYH